MREPVVAGTFASPCTLAAPRTGDVGDHAGEAPGEPSDQVVGSTSDATTERDVTAPSAVKKLAAAKGSLSDEQPKKETAAGALRDGVRSNIEQEKSSGSASAQERPSSGGSDWNGVSERAFRQAVPNMVVACTDKGHHF